MRLTRGPWGAPGASHDRSGDRSSQRSVEPSLRHLTVHSANVAITRRQLWTTVGAMLLVCGAVLACATWIHARGLRIARTLSAGPAGTPPATGAFGAREPTRATTTVTATTTSRDSSASITGAARRKLRAVLVAQRRDCNGNLDFFAMMGRRRIAAAIQAADVLVEGIPSDTLSIRGLLPRPFTRASLRLLTSSDRDLVQSLGYQTTPLLLLYDLDGRLMLALPALATAPERVAFTRALSLIADAQES